MSKNTMTPEEWLINGEADKASLTIWAVMMGIAKPDDEWCGWEYDLPLNPCDFGRCCKLLKRFPEWLGRLDEIPKIFPAWKPTVEAWCELTSLYEKERKRDDLKAPVLYRRLQELREEGMIASGFEKIGNSWKPKENRATIDKAIGIKNKKQRSLDDFFVCKTHEFAELIHNRIG